MSFLVWRGGGGVGITVLSQFTRDFLSASFFFRHASAWLFFLSWGNSGALAWSFPDSCLLVIHFHQPAPPSGRSDAATPPVKLPGCPAAHRRALKRLKKKPETAEEGGREICFYRSFSEVFIQAYFIQKSDANLNLVFSESSWNVTSDTSGVMPTAAVWQKEKCSLLSFNKARIINTIMIQMQQK